MGRVTALAAEQQPNPARNQPKRRTTEALNVGALYLAEYTGSAGGLGVSRDVITSVRTSITTLLTLRIISIMSNCEMNYINGL